MTYLNVDKENYLDAELDAQRHQKNNLLLKVRDKMLINKGKPSRRKGHKPATSHTLDSLSNHCKSRLTSMSMLPKQMKVRKFEN